MMIEMTEEGKKLERIEMIRETLKNKAPLMYSELETTGQLPSFLEEREAEMMTYFREAQQKAWDETLTTFLDFFDSSYDETTSPM